MSKIEDLKELLHQAHKVVAITGAGISTESGIPDFRSQSGIYKTMTTPLLFSPWYIRLFPGRWYKKMAPMCRKIVDALPNKGHVALACLETPSRSVHIATQNIDGLHQAAGSSHVHELHGSVRRFYCMKCMEWQWQPVADDLLEQIEAGKPPRCHCGGYMRPDIVMFGEQLPKEPMLESIRAMLDADAVLVLGTSLRVSTGTNLLRYRLASTPVVVINKDETPADEFGTIVIHDRIGETLSAAV